jgi:hypothetical protein
MRRAVVVTSILAALLAGGLVCALLLGGRWLARSIPDPHSGAPTTPDVSLGDSGATPAAPPMTDAEQLALAVHPLRGGETLVSADEIAAWLTANPVDVDADGVATDARLREAEVQCMAGKGWWFDPRRPSELTLARLDGPERLALNGPDYGMQGPGPDSCEEAGLVAIGES